MGAFLRASVGFCPRLAPVFDWLVLRVLGLGCALPAVFCPWSCVSLPLVLGPFFVVFWLCWCFCLRFCGCFFRGRRAPLSVWWGFFAFVLCLAVVGSPPLPVVASPPVVGPLWRPGPVFMLVPPSGYLVASCDGLVALPSCWGCGGALSSSLHFVSWQQRPLALCGVCFTLYTMMHVLLGCSVPLR